MRQSLFLAALLVAVLGAGCSGQPIGTAPDGSPAPVDAAAHPSDADVVAPSPDGSATGLDVGVTTLGDGGDQPDAFVLPPDSGPLLADAGAPADAGFPRDASLPSDASTTTYDAAIVGDGGGVPWTCPQVIQCTSLCTDFPCISACIAQGSPAAQSQSQALLQCSFTHCSGSTDPYCTVNNCGTELQACYGQVPQGDGGTPSGDGGSGLTCLEIVQCTQGCPDQACAQACIAQGSPVAQSLAQTVLTCYLTHCYGSSDPNCLPANCPDELQACISNQQPAQDAGIAGDGGASADGGGLSCAEVLACLQACTDLACSQGCIAQGTPEAQPLAQAVMSCYLTYCYGSSDPNCITTNCGSQIQACVNGAARDGGVGVGDAGVPSTGDGGAPLTNDPQAVDSLR